MTEVRKIMRRDAERAVKGMLPHNHLGSQVYRKLFVYAGEDYEQKAQKPVKYEVK